MIRTLNPSAALRKEVEAIYPYLAKEKPESFPRYLGGREGSEHLGNPSDQDRLIGGGCGLKSGNVYQLKTLDKNFQAELHEIQVPDNYQAQDLSYDARRGLVALHGQIKNSNQWSVTLYDIHGGPQGQEVYHCDHRLASLEWSAQGDLLVADGQWVKKLENGQLVPHLDCGSEVKDISTLSDGGLCLYVTSPSPIQCDLLYQAPGSQELVKFPLPSTYQELPSPDGQQSIVVKKGDQGWSLFARSQGEDLGPILKPQAIPHNLPFQHGAEHATAQWSPDSRFFSITSQKIPMAILDLRDTLIWDSQAKKTYQLPGVEALKFSQQGDLELQLNGEKTPLQLVPETLEQLDQQPWYQRNQQQPIITLLYSSPNIFSRQDGQSKLLEPASSANHYAPNRDRTHLIRVTQDGSSAKIWDLKTGKPFSPPPSHYVYWDANHDQLGVIAGDPPKLELVAGSNFQATPWYRQSLEKQSGLATPLASRVEQQEGDTVYNGLKMPKKTPPTVYNDGRW